jgi:hypothetical protein
VLEVDCKGDWRGEKRELASSSSTDQLYLPGQDGSPRQGDGAHGIFVGNCMG